MGPDDGAETRDHLSGSETRDQAQQRILYPVFDSYNKHSFEIARDIAAGADAELLVLDFVENLESLVDESRTVGSKLLQAHLDEQYSVESQLLLKEKTNPVKTVTRVARQRDVRLLVFDEHTPASLTGVVRGDMTERISSQAPCDAVTITHARKAKRIGSILVPVAGGNHSELAVIVAGAVALGVNAVVELFHVSPSIDSVEKRRVEELFMAAKNRLPAAVDVDTWHIEQSDIATAIVEQSRHYDVTVVGKPRANRLLRFITGSITEEVSEQSENTVLMSRRSDELGFNL